MLKVLLLLFEDVIYMLNGLGINVDFCNVIRTTSHFKWFRYTSPSISQARIIYKEQVQAYDFNVPYNPSSLPERSSRFQIFPSMLTIGMVKLCADPKSLFRKLSIYYLVESKGVLFVSRFKNDPRNGISLYNYGEFEVYEVDMSRSNFKRQKGQGFGY